MLGKQIWVGRGEEIQVSDSGVAEPAAGAGGEREDVRGVPLRAELRHRDAAELRVLLIAKARIQQRLDRWRPVRAQKSCVVRDLVRAAVIVGCCAGPRHFKVHGRAAVVHKVAAKIHGQRILRTSRLRRPGLKEAPAGDAVGGIEVIVSVGTVRDGVVSPCGVEACVAIERGRGVAHVGGEPTTSHAGRVRRVDGLGWIDGAGVLHQEVAIVSMQRSVPDGGELDLRAQRAVLRVVGGVGAVAVGVVDAGRRRVDTAPRSIAREEPVLHRAERSHRRLQLEFRSLLGLARLNLHRSAHRIASVEHRRRPLNQPDTACVRQAVEIRQGVAHLALEVRTVVEDDQDVRIGRAAYAADIDLAGAVGRNAVSHHAAPRDKYGRRELLHGIEDRACAGAADLFRCGDRLVGHLVWSHYDVYRGLHRAWCQLVFVIAGAGAQYSSSRLKSQGGQMKDRSGPADYLRGAVRIGCQR